MLNPKNQPNQENIWALYFFVDAPKRISKKELSNKYQKLFTLKRAFLVYKQNTNNCSPLNQ